MSVDTNEKSDATQELGEQELCIECMAGNRPGSHFCCKCGAPLTSYAATGPFESLFAEGHIYRKATDRPHRFIIVLGIWLIFGTMTSAGANSVVLIAKTTHNYRKRRRSLGSEVIGNN